MLLSFCFFVSLCVLLLLQLLILGCVCVCVCVCVCARRTLGDSAVPYGSDFPLRPHEPTAIEYLILIWVAGEYLLITGMADGW